MYEWFVLYIVDPDGAASVYAFIHCLLTQSPTHTLSLSQHPIPYMLVLGSSDKETDVADVDVNSMKPMLLYRGC